MKGVPWFAEKRKGLREMKMHKFIDWSCKYMKMQIFLAWSSYFCRIFKIKDK